MSRLTHVDGSIEYVLSPMDSIMARFNLNILHVFPPHGIAYDLKQLQSSLAVCIAQDYPMLVGEQRMDPKSGVVSVFQHVDAQPYVVPFIVDETCAMDTSAAIATMSNTLMPPPRDRQQHVLTVKCSLLSDGGLAIGVDCSHCVVDGEGFFQFMKVWGMHYRNLSPHDRPTINHDRFLLNAKGTGAKGPHPELRVLAPQSTARVASECKQFPSTTQQIFHLSPSFMQELKKSANQAHCEVSTSTMDAITALFTILISQARDHGQSVKLTTAVNARKRLQPALPSHFAGNATFNALSSYTANEVGTALNPHALQIVAQRIRESIQACTEEYMRDVIEFITSQPSTQISQLQANRDFFYGCDLLFSSWVHLGMYEMNFGATPWYCGPSLRLCDGIVIMTEAQRGESGVDVLVLLETTAMERLRRLWEEYTLGRS